MFVLVAHKVISPVKNPLHQINTKAQFAHLQYSWILLFQHNFSMSVWKKKKTWQIPRTPLCLFKCSRALSKICFTKRFGGDSLSALCLTEWIAYTWNDKVCQRWRQLLTVSVLFFFVLFHCFYLERRRKKGFGARGETDLRALISLCQRLTGFVAAKPTESAAFRNEGEWGQQY